MQKIPLFFLLLLLFSFVSSQTPEMYLTRGHADDIRAIAVTFDGRLMASGGEDNKIFIWDIASGRMLIEIAKHTDQIEELIFSTDGKYLLSSGDDEKTYVWETESGSLAKTLPLGKQANCLGYGPKFKYVVTGHGNAKVQVLNARTFDIVKSFSLPQYTSVLHYYAPESGDEVFTLDSQYFLESKKSKMFITKWDLGSMTQVSRKEWTQERFPDAVAKDGSVFYKQIMGNDPIELYSTSDLKLKESIAKDEWPVFVEAYLGGEMVLGRYKHGAGKELKDKLAEFNFRTGELSDNYGDLSDDFDKMTLSPRKDLFVFLEEKYKTDHLTVVSREAKISLQTTYNLSSVAMNVETHPSRPLIASQSRAAGFTLLDLAQGEFIQFNPKLQDRIIAAWFSPDGKYMIADVYRAGLQGIDLDSREVLYTLEEKVKFVDVAFSPNGKWVAASVANGRKYSAVVYDLETGAEKYRSPELSVTFPQIEFLDDNRLYLSDDDGFGIFDLTTSSYDKKTDASLKNIEDAKVGSKIFPDDYYRLSFNRTRNELILGNRRTFLVVDPQSLMIKKKFVWDGPQTELMTSFTPSPDGNFIAGGNSAMEIIIWDLNTGKYQTIKNAHSTDIKEPIRWTYDSKFLLSAADDGGIKFWEPKTGAFVGQYVNTDTEEFLIYTAENYYYATKGALPFIGFKLKSKIYPYEQFDLKFNRPDKVLEKFAYVSKLKSRMFSLAYQKRLRRLGFTEDKLASDFHTPEIEVVDRGELPILAANASQSFKIKAYDSKYGLKSLNVYVNDVPLYGRNGRKFPIAPGKNHEESIDLKLSPGRNVIKVSVVNELGTESPREGFMMYCTQKFEKADMYLLAIGVSEYKDAERNLTYAAKDAKDLIEKFKGSQSFADVHTFSLLNSEATRENVEGMREKLAAAKENDLVIVYVSSHGLLDEKLDYFLAMHGTNFENPAEGGLPYTSLENLLDGLASRNRLVLIDACHSGEIDKEEAELTEAVASAEPSQTKVSIAFKSGPKGVKPKAGLTNSFEYMKALFADVSSGLGATIISAAGGYEYALESEGWNNGVFTYSILEGIKSRKADANHDRIFQISELRDYVVDKVYNLTNGKQMPTVRKQNPVIDFKVY